MPGGSKKGGGLIVKKSAFYQKQEFGEAISPFRMNGFSGFGNSPLHQKKETPKDLVDVLSLIPGIEYVKKSLRKVKERVHKSKFMKKYLVVDPNPKLSKIGKFVKRHLSDPDKDIK